jgi:acyl-CoA thioester hydrolase
MSGGAALGGELTPEGHVLPVRVYYEDTDFSGTVYHGSYVRFLERGRSDFLRCVGVSHAELSVAGLHFAVSEMTLSFRRAARIDDIVDVVTKVAEMTGARVVLDQSLRRGDEALVEARVTVALVDRSGRPRRFPDKIREALSFGRGGS